MKVGPILQEYLKQPQFKNKFMNTSSWQKYLHEAWKVPLRLKNHAFFNDMFISKDIAKTPYQVLSRRGRCRLLHFDVSSGIKPKNKSYLIIPSLINRYYILDLYNGCSLIEYLVDKGIEVYVLDWGNPRPQDQFATIEDHITHHIDWASNFVLKRSRELNILGHCIGGTLSLIYASLFSEKLNSLCLMTTPVDFSKAGVLATWANLSSLDIEKMIDLWGNIKSEFLDQSFKMISPLSDLKMKRQYLIQGWDRDFVKKYKAINFWVKDSIHFPGNSYKEFVNSFYKKNQLFNETYNLANGKSVSLSNIKCPVLNIMALGDVIVPNHSSEALMSFLPEGQLENFYVKGGHIGHIISERHQEKLWEKVYTNLIQ